MAFLYEEDQFRRNVMLKVASRYFEMLLELHDDLASKIIKRLADATKKG